MTGNGCTDSRQPVPVDTGDGLTVLYKDRWLYSRRAPHKNPVLAASSLDLKPETLVFCPSPLLGYGLPELLSRLPPRCTVLAVEADETLMAFSLSFINKDLLQDPRLKYVRTASIHRLLELIDSLPEAPFRRTARIDLSGGTAVADPFYKAAQSSLDEYLSRWWKNRFTLMRLGRNYARNVLTNVGLAKRARPFAIPPGKMVFLAAAGPSLEAAVSIVHAFRDRFFVAAVDTAARYLCDSGIRPDTVILVESQYWIDSAFQGLCGSGIPVWADLTARTASILRTNGPISFFVSEYAKTSLLERLKCCATPPLAIPPLGSVGLAALHLLCELREPGTPIFFAGLDFSWKRGYTHVRSAPAALTSLYSGNRLSPPASRSVPGAGTASAVRGTDGIVTSDRLLTDYAAQAQALAARIAASGRGPCFNLVSGGLEIGFPFADPTLLEKVHGEFTSSLSKGINGPEPGISGRDGLNGSDTGNFLRRETEIVSRLEALLLDRETCGKIADDGLNEAMNDLDYLWLHFPDAARGCNLEPDFLGRTKAGIGYFRKSISRAFSFLSS